MCNTTKPDRRQYLRGDNNGGRQSYIQRDSEALAVGRNGRIFDIVHNFILLQYNKLRHDLFAVLVDNLSSGCSRVCQVEMRPI
jgi:hypothetical protein